MVSRSTPLADTLQVAGAGLKLSHTLCQYVDGVATADRRIKDIAKEIRLTSFVLKELGNVFESDDTKALISDGARQTADETLKECSDVFAEIDATLTKSKKNTFGRLMLPFRDTKIELLRSHIDKLKDTLKLLLKVLSIAHHVATKKLNRKAEAEAKAQIQELIDLNKRSTQKYAESLRNYSSSDSDSEGPTMPNSIPGTEKQTVLSDPAQDMAIAIQAISSSINPKTLASCAQHVRSLLDSIETLQQALTNVVDGSDHSTHHQGLIDSYFRARGHLDGVIFRGSPQQDSVTDAKSGAELTKKLSLSSGSASTHGGARVKPQIVIDFGTTKGKVSARNVSVSTKPYDQRFDGIDAESPSTDAAHTIRTELNAALEQPAYDVDDKYNIAPWKAPSHGLLTDEETCRTGYPAVPSLSLKRFTSNPRPSSTILNVSSDAAPDSLEVECLESLFEHNSAASEDASTDDISHDGPISGMGSWNHEVRHSGPQDMFSMTPLRLGPQYEHRRGLSSSSLVPSIADTGPNTPNPFHRPTATDLHDRSSGKDTAAKPSQTNTPDYAHNSPTIELNSKPVVSDGRHRRDRSSPSSSSGTNPSRSSRILMTSGTENEIRLRADETMPLSLQFNGDMEGRTLQLVPTESGMTDMVIGDNGSRSSRTVYRSERDSVARKNKSAIAGHRRREAEDVSERSKNLSSASSMMSLMSTIGSRSPRLRRSKQIVDYLSETASQRSDPNAYYLATSAQGPAVVQTARTRRQASAAHPRPQTFAGDSSTFWAPGMPLLSRTSDQRGPAPSFSAYQNARPQQTSYYPPVYYGYPPVYYAQQHQPFHAQQGSPISTRPSISHGQRDSSAPTVTQEGQFQYSARSGQASVPNARPFPSQRMPSQYGEQDPEGSSESEHSEDEEDEREVHQQQERATRALIPPPELRRNASHRRPTLTHEKTTQVAERLDANRCDKRRQSITIPDRAVPRERLRERERVPELTAGPSRRPSVSRPTSRPSLSRSTQSENSSRLVSIQLGDSGYDRCAYYDQDRDRASGGQYDAERRREKRCSNVIIQGRYMPSLPDNDDDSEEEDGEEDDAWALIDPQENMDLMSKVKEDAKSKQNMLNAEEYIHATRGSGDPYANQINKAALKRASRKPSLPSKSSGSRPNVTRLLPAIGSEYYQAKAEEYCSDESDGGHVMADSLPRRSSPTAKANVRTKRSKDLNADKAPVLEKMSPNCDLRNDDEYSSIIAASTTPASPSGNGMSDLVIGVTGSRSSNSARNRRALIAGQGRRDADDVSERSNKTGSKLPQASLTNTLGARSARSRRDHQPARHASLVTSTQTSFELSRRGRTTPYYSSPEVEQSEIEGLRPREENRARLQEQARMEHRQHVQTEKRVREETGDASSKQVTSPVASKATPTEIKARLRDPMIADDKAVETSWEDSDEHDRDDTKSQTPRAQSLQNSASVSTSAIWKSRNTEDLTPGSELLVSRDSREVTQSKDKKVVIYPLDTTLDSMEGIVDLRNLTTPSPPNTSSIGEPMRHHGLFARLRGKPQGLPAATEGEGQRIRGRSRSRSTSKRVGPKHRDNQVAQVGIASAATAGFLERCRSKSRQRDGQRSRSRVREGVPIAATGITGNYIDQLTNSNDAERKDGENEQGKEDAELETLNMLVQGVEALGSKDVGDGTDKITKSNEVNSRNQKNGSDKEDAGLDTLDILLKRVEALGRTDMGDRTSKTTDPNDTKSKDEETERNKNPIDLDMLPVQTETSKTQTQFRARRKPMKRKLSYINSGMIGGRQRGSEFSVKDEGEGSEEEYFIHITDKVDKAPASESVTVNASEGVASSESPTNFDEVDELLKEWTTVF